MVKLKFRLVTPHCPKCGGEMEFLLLSIEGKPMGGHACAKCGYWGRPREWKPQSEEERLFNRVFKAVCGIELDDFLEYVGGPLIREGPPTKEWLNVRKVDFEYAALFSWLAKLASSQFDYELWIENEEVYIGYDSPLGGDVMEKVEALMDLHEALVKKGRGHGR
jgi:hypothetical protein